MDLKLDMWIHHSKYKNPDVFFPYISEFKTGYLQNLGYTELYMWYVHPNLLH